MEQRPRHRAKPPYFNARRPSRLSESRRPRGRRATADDECGLSVGDVWSERTPTWGQRLDLVSRVNWWLLAGVMNLCCVEVAGYIGITPRESVPFVGYLQSERWFDDSARGGRVCGVVRWSGSPTPVRAYYGSPKVEST